MRLGSFTLVGRCATHIVFKGTFAQCTFKGRQPWLLNGL